MLSRYDYYYCSRVTSSGSRLQRPSRIASLKGRLIFESQSKVVEGNNLSQMRAELQRTCYRLLRVEKLPLADETWEVGDRYACILDFSPRNFALKRPEAVCR